MVNQQDMDQAKQDLMEVSFSLIKTMLTLQTNIEHSIVGVNADLRPILSDANFPKETKQALLDKVTVLESLANAFDSLKID